MLGRFLVQQACYNGSRGIKTSMKKQNILLVLKMLEVESDKSHPLTQTEIADTISAKYPCDRKTVGRNIKFLIDMGYPIVKTPRGFYLDNRLFTVEERNLILAAVSKSADIPEEPKPGIIKRLSILLNRIQTY